MGKTKKIKEIKFYYTEPWGKIKITDIELKILNKINEIVREINRLKEKI